MKKKDTLAERLDVIESDIERIDRVLNFIARHFEQHDYREKSLDRMFSKRRALDKERKKRKDDERYVA